MSVPHPGGDPNANFYAQLKRDVLDRLPQITTVEFVPDDIEAKQLRARFDPARLDPSTGPESPELSIKWYRQEPHDWLRINYTDPNDPRRRGVRWEDLSLDDGSMDVYRKKQQWDAASLPDPVISPLRSYRQLMDPPTERWPVFPTFDQRTLAGLVQDELADRGERPEAITERREEYARDLLLALAEDIRPPSITTDGARSILQRLSEDGEIDIDHPKHDYLAPHGGRRGMGEVLVRAFGYTVAARYLDNSEEMVRESYSHIEAGELGDVATEALDEVDSIPREGNKI